MRTMVTISAMMTVYVSTFAAPGNVVAVGVNTAVSILTSNKLQIHDKVLQ